MATSLDETSVGAFAVLSMLEKPHFLRDSTNMAVDPFSDILSWPTPNLSFREALQPAVLGQSVFRHSTS